MILSSKTPILDPPIAFSLHQSAEILHQSSGTKLKPGLSTANTPLEGRYPNNSSYYNEYASQPI